MSFPPNRHVRERKSFNEGSIYVKALLKKKWVQIYLYGSWTGEIIAKIIHPKKEEEIVAKIQGNVGAEMTLIKLIS
jgi:hypothetical protein